ncbi:MAG: helix-turn-helix transcriptional regulator [Clostridia bacterium]|nr:helix-turn-helix transcriptional regulator [Clostridia bacterium]
MKDDYGREQDASRFTALLCKARNDAGKSQHYMAVGLGVSKKTIQNWERGVTFPDITQYTAWFKLLGLDPLHYLTVSDSADSDEDRQLEEQLIMLIRRSSAFEKRELLYLMAGKHGSSWYSLLQMFTTHCHTTMQSRVTAARLILENYEMEAETDELVLPDEITPDLTTLKRAITQGKQAAQKKENGYI